MTSRTYYRAAVAVVCFIAVITPAVLIFGSTLTRALFVIALVAAGSLIYRYGRTN
jgi:hypothetical protein